MQTITGEVNDRRASEATEVIIKLGLDVHADQITVCRQYEGSLPQPAQKQRAEQLLKMVEEHRRLGHRVYSCYEAGPCGYGLHRELTGRGVTNYVVAPQRWDERSERVKTDRRDARELCDRLDRYVRGNTRAFCVVLVPTPAQEQRRALGRYRSSLQKEKQRCIVRGHGLMLTQGIRAGRDWWMPEAWTQLWAHLPDWLREEVHTWQKQALHYQGQVEALSERIAAKSEGRPLVKGLGALSTELLEAEIIDWHRFKNRRQPGSYSGLCPSEYSTNQRRRQGAVNKHGNPHVRHLLVEAVWRLLYWQPNYKPLFAVRAALGARARKRAAVAAARHLMVDLWRMNTKRCAAQAVGLKLTEA